MKKIILGALALTLSIVSFAQKPQKTYDENKFMKKVQFSFTPELIEKNMPDEEALQYISEKSGKSLEELKTENAANLENIKNGITEINALGLAYVWDNIEVKVIQESPVKIANLLIQCHAKEKVFVLNLTNCVQTNISWYLGDGIVPEGDGFEGAVTAKASKKKLGESGLLGKMKDLDEGMKDMENKAQVQLIAQQLKKDSINELRPGFETTYESFIYDESKNNAPIQGYYILNDGTKVNAVILNQAPEYFVGDSARYFKLTICKNDESAPDNAFNANHPNFKEYIYKKDIKAFYVNGYLYRKSRFPGWVIQLNEGAIHSYITVVKLTMGEKSSYQRFKQTQKLEGTSYGSPVSSISEKNLLGMMEDAPEIVQGYKDGKYNLESAEIEYNIWFDKNNPGKVDYLFGVDGKQ
jgi:hypothetical protein